MTYSIVCLLTAGLSAAGTWLLCRYLLTRLGMRELGVKDIPATVRDVPEENGYVPRCGGLLPCAAVFASALVMLLVYSLLLRLGSSMGIPRLSRLQNMYIWGGLIMAPIFAAAGFMDDYALVFRRMRKGMESWQRLLVQTAIAAAFLTAIWLAGDKGAGMTVIPFLGTVELGFWYYPLSLLLIVAVVRGLELAQEAEGTMPTVGFFAFLTFMVVCCLLSVHDTGTAHAGIMAIAGVSGCLAFLPYNFAPAQARTGTAGGAFMGALLCAVGFASQMPVLLLLVGAIYIAESVTALAGWLCEKFSLSIKPVPLHRMIGRKGKNDIQITVFFAASTAFLGAAAAALAIFT